MTYNVFGGTLNLAQSNPYPLWPTIRCPCGRGLTINGVASSRLVILQLRTDGRTDGQGATHSVTNT